MNSQSGNVSEYPEPQAESLSEATLAAWRELEGQLGWPVGAVAKASSLAKNMRDPANKYNEGLNKALLSMDEEKIRSFYITWCGDDLHPDKEIFWVAIHKTITGRKSLPITFRMRSKQWLAQRNQFSLDDGELDAYLKKTVDDNDVPF